MTRLRRSFADWLDDRTGFRQIRHRVLDEPLPAGTGWWFTLGGLLLFGLFLQVVTGAGLALFYVPTAGQAWDSVRFVVTRVRGGAFLRGVHYWGASLVVIAAVLHMVRVVFFGSYRKPREVTWLIGLATFAVILGLALTGAVLPWDQRAYWSVAAPLGAGALTPWYVIHVIVLPVALLILTVTHLYLLRRHGISGPAMRHPGPSQPFYPALVMRIRVVVLVAVAVVAVLAWIGAPALQPPADPASHGDAARPDWYFLGLSQVLRHVPGRWALPVTLSVIGLGAAFLALLPWLDRARTREAGPRWRVLVPFSGLLALMAVLTSWGVRTVPPVGGGAWNFQEIAGASLIQTSDRCVRCHGASGMAAAIEPGHLTRRQDWLAMHVGDPEVLAAGIREAPVVNRADSRAMIAALSHLRSGPPPAVEAGTLRVYTLFSRYCFDCHQLDGAGGSKGPDLSRAGLKYSATTLEQRIADAHDSRADTGMPSFSGIIDPADIRALAEWLSQRK